MLASAGGLTITQGLIYFNSLKTVKIFGEQLHFKNLKKLTSFWIVYRTDFNLVNNWFGNKRIRYKRKCLEEEAKRSRLMDGGVEAATPGKSKKKANAKKAVMDKVSWLDKVPDDEEEDEEMMA
jgi:hypothetical protein